VLGLDNNIQAAAHPLIDNKKTESSNRNQKKNKILNKK
jgi:hypothetical protein